MEDTIRLIKIEPYESNVMYKVAKQSYKDIHNNSMAKGKGNLEPKFMGGNPIQLYPGNMNSLFKVHDENIMYNDYLVSTKANGMRFMLMISNKDKVIVERQIYFVDSKLNFWYIENLPPIPANLNVDKCLIDGEMLFWGAIKTQTVINSEGKKEVKEYTITKSKTVNKPLIGFLAFDILYGPINPDYIRDKETEITGNADIFQLGNSGAMLGPKATNRWPTRRRRHVLEEMFLNVDSPLWSYVHKQSEKTLNTPTSSFNFTIFVSPFVKMDELLEKYALNIYPVMIKILQNEIIS